MSLQLHLSPAFLVQNPKEKAVRVWDGIDPDWHAVRKAELDKKPLVGFSKKFIFLTLLSL